jgi:DNA-binding transcriptional regulator YdaS (Cro superfamily)
MSDQFDYQIKAARVGRAYLEGCLLQLREAVVSQWLVENRRIRHPRIAAIDGELTLYRLHRNASHLDQAELYIERYA